MYYYVVGISKVVVYLNVNFLKRTSKTLTNDPVGVFSIF